MANIKASEVIFFCHGAPGSARDAELLSNLGEDVTLLTPNLFSGMEKNGDPIRETIKQFDKMTAGIPDGRVHVVGFSIGAMVAIEIAATRPARIGRLTLISPAAPLDLGDFLQHMAGKPVFELAFGKPLLLKLLTFAQGVFARIFPNFLIKQLFSKCGAIEKSLLNDPVFRGVLRAGVLNSFCKFPDAYMNLLRCYVGNWGGQLALIQCPVEIWHGEKDTWSPIEMSYALCENISGRPILHVVAEAEHYSTLTRATIQQI